jgi:HAMP domain-containing protein
VSQSFELVELWSYWRLLLLLLLLLLLWLWLRTPTQPLLL